MSSLALPFKINAFSGSRRPPSQSQVASSVAGTTSRSGVEDGFGLQVGVVGGAHHRAAGDLVETN